MIRLSGGMNPRSRSATFAALWMTLVSGLFWSPAASAAQDFSGVWRNPGDTVHLELRPCGENICGEVVWATDAARKAALRFSDRELVGQQLFRDFKRGEDRTARGKVFVPDLGLTFKGAAQHRDSNTIKVKGCVLGNLICKSQVWTRLPENPH